MWRVSVLLLAALLVCGLAVWWSRAGSSGETFRSNPEATAQGLADRAGPPLPAAGTLDPLSDRKPELPTQSFHEPVVVASCSLAPVQEQDVSSQIDGVFDKVLVDLGEQVAQGQVLGRLDDRLLRPEVEVLRIKAASESAKLIARAQYDEMDLKTNIAEKLLAKGVTPSVEYKTFAYQRERYAEEIKKAREDQEVARKELEKALTMLELHAIRSAVAGEVTKVYKREGEAVRQMEPLFRVANFNRLRVEGLCKVQQADQLRVGMRALVEPEQPSEQLRELSGHTGPVTSVAVSPDGRWVASASEDRTVILWSWPQGQRQATLAHPAEVHAVALMPAADGAGCHLVTGCADGGVRLWSVSARGSVEGPTLWPSCHEGAIHCLAISPDGQWCATAGEDRRIGIWDLAAGKRLYWLRGEGNDEAAHQGAVTWVQFTPDRRLLSAGRDNVLRLWKLEEGGATLVATQSGRTGEVGTLGVTSDGRHVLFDNGEELRILERESWACLGSLRSRRQGRFQGFALFAPSNRLLLAAASNGRVQLWKVPPDPDETNFFRQGYAHGFGRDSLLPLGALGSMLTPAGCVPVWAALTTPSAAGEVSGVSGAPPRLWGLHGYEVRHFVTPGSSTVTCGAFAPDESVAFTGGSDGALRVWAIPPSAEWGEPWEATITFVASQVERGTDGVRIRAEMDNPAVPARRLRPGSYVDLTLYPETTLPR